MTLVLLTITYSVKEICGDVEQTQVTIDVNDIFVVRISGYSSQFSLPPDALQVDSHSQQVDVFTPGGNGFMPSQIAVDTLTVCDKEAHIACFRAFSIFNFKHGLHGTESIGSVGCTTVVVEAAGKIKYLFNSFSAFV